METSAEANSAIVDQWVAENPDRGKHFVETKSPGWVVVDIVDGNVFGNPFTDEEAALKFLRRYDEDMFAGTEEGFGLFHKQVTPVAEEEL